MVTNFEDITPNISEQELDIIPLLVAGFSSHGKNNPIKAPQIVEQMNAFLSSKGYKIRMSEPRLRRCVNYIRSNSLLPLIATSDGYYVSYDPEEITSQIKSLRERASAIRVCADGLAAFVNQPMP